ncbi:MAG: class II aldolase and adducin N-terminal domain-containing protein [Helicobacteraceae bacterium]
MDELISDMSKVALSMFRKDFFGIFHGSISARVELSKFLINKKDAIFDNINQDSLILLNRNKDYRWNDASIDADIHSAIYQAISDAKFIAYAMPPFVMSYMLESDYIVPKDYFGNLYFKNLKIYSPKNFDDWYERAAVEISRYFETTRTEVMPINGYGIYAYARELPDLAKKIAIIENSCRILIRSKK